MIIDLSKNKNLERFLSPINQSTNFIFNKFFRKLLKIKIESIKILEIKGRKLEIQNFYERVVKFNFNELCDRNLGSEDYIVLQIIVILFLLKIYLISMKIIQISNKDL